jgi:DNA-binding transcriptional regulator YiaG
MPNIASALKAEIIRVARKEMRAESENLKHAAAKSRAEILALKQRVVDLEKTIARISKVVGKAPERKREQGKVPSVRFTAKGLISMRRRLGLSASEMGSLVGVSTQTVYNWEAEKSKPRPQQMASLASLRSIGKRQAAARLNEMAAVNEE